MCGGQVCDSLVCKHAIFIEQGEVIVTAVPAKYTHVPDLLNTRTYQTCNLCTGMEHVHWCKNTWCGGMKDVHRLATRTASPSGHSNTGGHIWHKHVVKVFMYSHVVLLCGPALAWPFFNRPWPSPVALDCFLLPLIFFSRPKLSSCTPTEHGQGMVRLGRGRVEWASSRRSLGAREFRV